MKTIIINEMQKKKIFDCNNDATSDKYYIGSEGGNNDYHHVCEMKAYHGSQKQFNRFNGNFHGSGDGSESFGPGHYFTNSKSIGRDYANEHGTSQKDAPHVVFNNSDESSSYQSLALCKALPSSAVPNKWVAQEFFMKLFNDCQTKQEFVRKAFSYAVKNIKSNPDYNEDKEWYDYDIEKTLNLLKSKIQQKPRSLYQVEIPDEGYVEWEDAVPKEIVDFCSRCINDFGTDRMKKNWSRYLENDFTFERLYLALENMDWDATFGRNLFKQALKRFNYIGVKYPAGTNFQTSHTKLGDTNYTVFDDDNIKITNRWDL